MRDEGLWVRWVVVWAGEDVAEPGRMDVHREEGVVGPGI